MWTTLGPVARVPSPKSHSWVSDSSSRSLEAVPSKVTVPVAGSVVSVAEAMGARFPGT